MLEYDGPFPEPPFGDEQGWIIEQGIGETRALFIGETGEIERMKLHWPGEILPGTIVQAKRVELISFKSGLFRTADGLEILVDKYPIGTTEGPHTVRIHRVPIAERGRFKRAQGRIVENHDTPQSDAASPFPDGKIVRSFPKSVWEDLWLTASSGEAIFLGGSLLFSVTPAMTLIDVDCDDPTEGAYGLTHAVSEIANLLRAFDLGGNIGIDFPTLDTKEGRKMVDQEFELSLSDWPHERTAMNGFGFVQIVARLEGPSLLHRFATSRVSTCARYALRLAERAKGTGKVLLLTIHPALKANLKAEWLEELARRTGKQVRIEANPGLALEAPQAQIIA